MDVTLLKALPREVLADYIETELESSEENLNTAELLRQGEEWRGIRHRVYVYNEEGMPKYNHIFLARVGLEVVRRTTACGGMHNEPPTHYITQYQLRRFDRTDLLVSLRTIWKYVDEEINKEYHRPVGIYGHLIDIHHVIQDLYRLLMDMV